MLSDHRTVEPRKTGSAIVIVPLISARDDVATEAESTQGFPVADGTDRGDGDSLSFRVALLLHDGQQIRQRLEGVIDLALRFVDWYLAGLD